MANTAFGHDATLTTPGSTTDTALVRWANTSGTSLNNTINILSDGSNITLNARGEVRFSDADSSHYIAFESPATVSTSYTMTLPSDLPAADEVLTVTSYSGGAGVLEWAAAAGGPTEASQTNMEAEATGTLYAPPDLIRYSPGVAKAWGDIEYNGTINAGYNVGSITQNAAGDNTANFTVAFSSANFCVVATARRGAGGDLNAILVATATGTCEVEVYDISDGANQDQDWEFIAMGDR
jgi:hypothetical protein